MKTILIALLSLGVSSTGLGVIIDNPLTLQEQFVAGILNGQPGNSNIATEQGYAQTILDLALGQKTGVAGAAGVFEANTVFNYSGTITSNGGQIDTGFDGVGGVNVPAGWGGALAKYDGPNGGYVLFLFGGQASVIPEFPWDFWTDNPEQYQISHYTLFNGDNDLTPTPFNNPVPEGGVGIGLLGFLLAGMGLARKALGCVKA